MLAEGEADASPDDEMDGAELVDAMRGLSLGDGGGGGIVFHRRVSVGRRSMAGEGPCKSQLPPLPSPAIAQQSHCRRLL